MRAAQDGWDDEAAPMCAAGRIVLNSGSDRRYSAVLTGDDGGLIERAFATMREAEAFVRRSTPAATAQCSVFERPADIPLTLKAAAESHNSQPVSKERARGP